MSDSPARTALLDAAEELFARHGIGSVSDRRIVEHAGAANHSAISYHFGGRQGLLETLIARHERQAVDSRAGFISGTSTSHEVLRGRIVPLAQLLESLPTPGWRAQFLAQARMNPDALPLLEAAARRSAAEILPDPAALSSEKPHTIMRARAGLVANMVMGVLAQQERQMNEGTAAGTWLDVAYFLVDAAAGMIDAPVTYTGPVPRDAGVPLI